MSRLAVSNIGLPPFDHLELLPRLAALGVSGLEVAPSRIWADTWRGLAAAQVGGYRRAVEAAGLEVVGLHSLFFDHPGLGLFKGRETLQATIDFMRHLSALCRDLGGRTLIYGGGRKRDSMDPDAAMAECREFLDQVLPTFEAHGTKLCFEPLGPRDTDFLNTAAENLALFEELGHPGLGLQLDAKALVDNDEVDPATFEAVKGRLDHFHANDPGLVALGSTGQVDHARFGQALRAIGYDGWVSSEQRMLPDLDPMAVIAQSVATLHHCYRARNDRDGE
jgi:sugar phosphate isomerase/epimerase